MRNFIEKLAKLVETEGVWTGGTIYKVFYYEIWYIIGCLSEVTIENNITQEKAHIKLYEEEQDILKKAFNRCEERTTDSIIEQLNKL